MAIADLRKKHFCPFKGHFRSHQNLFWFWITSSRSFSCYPRTRALSTSLRSPSLLPRFFSDIPRTFSHIPTTFPGRPFLFRCPKGRSELLKVKCSPHALSTLRKPCISYFKGPPHQVTYPLDYRKAGIEALANKNILRSSVLNVFTKDTIVKFSKAILQ